MRNSRANVTYVVAAPSTFLRYPLVLHLSLCFPLNFPHVYFTPSASFDLPPPTPFCWKCQPLSHATSRYFTNVLTYTPSEVQVL